MFYSKNSNISLILFNKISASGILYVLKWTAFVLHVLKIETKEYSQDISSNNAVVHNQLSFFKNKITNYLWSPNSTKSWTSQIWHPQQIADKETFAHLERFWFFFGCLISLNAIVYNILSELIRIFSAINKPVRKI